jgi:ribosome-binding protein aMBF1 (putative translation factor)
MMIRSEAEYQEASRRILQERERLTEHKKRLEETGLSAAEVKRALDPLRSFHDQFVEEVESYERLKRGEFEAFQNLHGLGQALVALRIARGITQRELARRMDVHESQVSRDERNEYHAVTVQRASRILDALQIKLHCSFEAPVVRYDGSG